MSAYISKLNALVERDRAQRAARVAIDQTAAITAVRDRLTPLEDRLARLLATIPVEVQQQGLSLASLQAGLRGRWRGHCHPGELGIALRRLGWTRQRCWRGSDAGFSTLWYPIPIESMQR